MSRLPLCAVLFAALALPLVGASDNQPFKNPAYDYVAEGRGVWIDMPLREVDWDSVMAALSKAGFNMVFPFMISAGAAFYPSEFVPMVSKRDELKLCVEAAHKRGIEVHPLKVNWLMSNAPQAYNQKMIDAGRTQYAPDGRRISEVGTSMGYPRQVESLCPSQPVNRQLELNTMLEMVKKYDVDGVNFDYMRYEFGPFCYCEKCKVNFSAETRLELKWPDDVLKGGKYEKIYRDWRRHLITSQARDIATAVHAYDPRVCVSLSARRNVKEAFDNDAQVWWEWIKEGMLDFVAPMNYSPQPAEYVRAIKDHFPLVKGAIPYYGGVGAYLLRKAELVADTVQLGRGIGEDGYVHFSLNDVSPMLDQLEATGVNRAPALLPHRGPETRFLLESPVQESEEGFGIYQVGSPVNFKVDVMFKGKLREGISRIQGDVVLVKASGEVVSKIQPLDLNKAALVSLSVKPQKAGLYRLAVYGAMTLSTGEVKPFIVKSFPFQMRAS